MNLGVYGSAVITGIAVGGIYALIAVGITQIFRVTRILNFAHGGFVLWGAYIYGRLTIIYGWKVGYALAATVAIVGAMGYLSELVILRYAARATQANKLIITFGLLQFLTALSVLVFSTKPANAQPLVPPGGITIFGTAVDWEQLLNLGAAFAVVVGYGAFLRFTRLGLLTRATAEDPIMSTLLGARRQRIDAFNWTVAAMIAGLAGVLVASINYFQTTTFIGYLLISLLATLAAGLQSLTLTALGGLAVGVIYNVVGVASSAVGAGDAAVFAVIAVLVIIRRRWPSDVARIAWTRSTTLRSSYRGWFNQRVIITAAWLALFVAAATSDIWSTTGDLIFVYTVLCFSIVPVVGWTGQVSLAAGGFAGIGAYTTALCTLNYGIPVPLSVVVGLAAGAIAGVVVGLLTARLPLVLTAVVTLAFTNAVSNWFLYTNVFQTQAGQFTLITPSYMSTSLDMFILYACLTAVVAVLLSNLRRSDWGTRMLATREAPVMLRHFGVSPLRVRVYAFAVSGSLASLAGVMYAEFLGTSVPTTYGSSLSFEALLYAAAGGVAVLYGPIIGSIGFIGTNQLLGLARYGATDIPDLVSGAGVVQMMSMSQDGYASWLQPPERISLSNPSGKLIAAFAKSSFRFLLGPSANVTLALQGREESSSRGNGVVEQVDSNGSKSVPARDAAAVS